MVEAVAILKSFGPFISPIINKIAEKAAPYFGGDATAEKLDNLRTIILPQIQLVIEAAEAADKIAVLGPWLNKLKDAALEAEDVFDDWEYKCLEEQVNPPSRLLRLPHKALKKAKEFVAPVSLKTKLMKRLDKLEKVASEVGRFMKMLKLHKDFISNQHVVPSRDPTSPSLPPIFVGREQEHEYWVRTLTSPTDEEPESSIRSWRAPIHAIWGIGGAGKTTLVQGVFNDPNVIKHFGDMRIWVHVPHKLNAHQVTKEMIEFATKGECPKIDNLGALQAKLKEILVKSENKILLVLDDIWDGKPKDRMQLELLLQPLNEVGRRGSNVIITTRMEGVASMLGATNIVPLEDMEDEHCRSIILYYANRHMYELNADLMEMLNMIVSKLKNSPLAARVVGGMMQSLDAWSMILKGNILESTKDSLLWSFKWLPSHLKRCFAFCSLYPKNYYFTENDVHELVMFWIAHGFVEEPIESEDLTIEEKGRQYFNELVSFSFFQPDRWEGYNYVIHDLLHDLAEDVSKGHCFRIENDNTTNIPSSVIHLSIYVGNEFVMPIYDLKKNVNLRTFLVLHISVDGLKDIGKHFELIFEKLTKLRLLHFECHGLGKSFFRGNIITEPLHSYIGELKHLRHLQTWVVKKLPESLGTLYHLSYLLVKGHDMNERAPKSLNNLVNLRCLPNNVYIENIGKLTSLQTFKVYDAKRAKQYGLKQLEKLKQIRGRLEIEGLDDVPDKAGAVIAGLQEKRHVEELVLRWNNEISHELDMEELMSRWNDDIVRKVDMERDVVVLEGLEPHPNLKMLQVCDYKGTMPPSWMVNCRGGWLPNLTSLKLSSCRRLTQLPNLPSHLREIIIVDCPELVQLYPFPYRLEVLAMNDCPGTEAFFSNAIASHDEGEEQQHHHPLRILMISNYRVPEAGLLNKLLMSNKFSSLFMLELKCSPLITSLLLGPHLTALERLVIKDLENLRLINAIGSLISLKHLSVSGCPKLTETTEVIEEEDIAIGEGADIGRGEDIVASHRLSSFEGNLEIDDPLLLSALLQEHGLNSLVQVEIACHYQDAAFSAEQEGIFLLLTYLKHLSFESCYSLPSLPRTLQNLSSLEELVICNCPKIESLPNLPSSLQSLRIRSCKRIESLPNLPSSLQSLVILLCEKMMSLPNLPSSLQSLEIEHCGKIESLPNVPFSLLKLDIIECHPQLKANYKEDGPLRHQINSIPLISIF